MSADTDFDFSDVEPEPRETNVLPRSGTTRTGTRRGSRSAKRLSGLKYKLSNEMFQFGAMTGMVVPVTGYYISQESDPFCDAIVELAGKKAEWLDALEQVANIGPGIMVGRTVLGIGCALGVDRWHRTEGESGISPEKKAAMFLGVSAAYQAIYGDNDGENQRERHWTAPPGGTFVPVA